LPSIVKRAAVMREAVATTVSPDCDRRSRLPVMRLRASRAVRRLDASISFDWLTRGSAIAVIVARIRELGVTAAAALEGAQHAPGRVGEQQDGARELT